jgi:hypothetical protein
MNCSSPGVNASFFLTTTSTPMVPLALPYAFSYWSSARRIGVIAIISGIVQQPNAIQRCGVIPLTTPVNAPQYRNPPSHYSFCLPIAPVPLIFHDSYEFASISAHFALISWFLAFAASRLALVRSSLWARRHLLTAVFAPLHMPTAFHKNPLA